MKSAGEEALLRALIRSRRFSERGGEAAIGENGQLVISRGGKPIGSWSYTEQRFHFQPLVCARPTATNSIEVARHITLKQLDRLKEAHSRRRKERLMVVGATSALPMTIETAGKLV